MRINSLFAVVLALLVVALAGIGAPVNAEWISHSVTVFDSENQPIFDGFLVQIFWMTDDGQQGWEEQEVMLTDGGLAVQIDPPVWVSVGAAYWRIVIEEPGWQFLGGLQEEVRVWYPDDDAVIWVEEE